MERHKVPLYVALARKVGLQPTEQLKKAGWQPTAQLKQQRADEIKRLMAHMPWGSGIDNGTKLDEERSTEDRLVFVVGYHHMNDGGYYVGWTEHLVIVTASLGYEFHLKVTGRDRNGIKDYLGDLYADVLREEVEEYGPSFYAEENV